MGALPNKQQVKAPLSILGSGALLVYMMQDVLSAVHPMLEISVEIGWNPL